MTAINNFIDLAPELFSYFYQLRDYINILATSRSNPIKNALLHYFKSSQHFYFPVDRFSCNELLYLIQFHPNIKNITLNQYQRDLADPDKIHTECNDDLVDFLDLFSAQYPKVCKQLIFIRVFTLLVDGETDEPYYCTTGHIPIESYSKHFPTDSIHSALDHEVSSSLKYPLLKCFISNGDWYNRITPKHIEYISLESHSLHVIDIHNMIPMEDPDSYSFWSQPPTNPSQTTVFKQVFAKHHNLMFLRVRISQTCEQVTLPSIAAVDFEHANLDKLKVLMIENSAGFVWNPPFIELLEDKLNPNTFILLYLTREGLRVKWCWLEVMWMDFKIKFRKAIFQEKQVRNKWHILMCGKPWKMKCKDHTATTLTTAS
eukprot:332885_1